MSEPLVVIVTCPSQQEAESIAEAVVEQRLAACVNVAGPVRSFFRWEGALQKEAEWLLFVKSISERLEELCQELARLHSYDVPEIIAVPVSGGSEKYLKWLEEMSTPSAP